MQQALNVLKYSLKKEKEVVFLIWNFKKGVFQTSFLLNFLRKKLDKSSDDYYTRNMITLTKEEADMLETLIHNYFFAVIRGKNEEDACQIARQAILGGIKNIEITYSTPNALAAIRSLLEEFSSDDSIVIGAGTVMNEMLAQKAIEAGSQFLVSPHYTAGIQALAKAAGVPYFPGCATATEIVTAMEAGCPIIKLFPGGIMGPRFIKDIHGPIPEVKLMPSGGVSVENIAAWKQAGACAVGIGSALSSQVASEGYDSVKKIAQAFVAAVEG